jgi:hypothetical protein
MTRAEQQKAAFNTGRMTWAELLVEAEEIDTAYEQDYDTETTAFEFPDGSVAVYCGVEQSIQTYGCRQ